MSTEVIAPTAEDKARFDSARKELITALNRKRTADKALASLEVQIYHTETSYLTETAAHGGGNIVHGFDGYLKNQTVTRRRHDISDHDRLFTNSSLTSVKSLELSGEGDEAVIDDGGGGSGANTRNPTPALTTVVLPPASRTQQISAAQTKKDRDRDYQRRKRANASMRSTVSGDDDADASLSRRPSKRARLASEE